MANIPAPRPQPPPQKKLIKLQFSTTKFLGCLFHSAKKNSYLPWKKKRLFEMNIDKITQNQLKTCTKWWRSGNSDKGVGLTHGLRWWWSWRIRRRRSLGLNSPWPTSVFVKAIGSQGEHINKTMSFAISITLPNTTDADNRTDGGSASAAIMLHNVGIMSPLLSSTWNESLHLSWELSPSQYVLHLKKKKRKEHHNKTFKTKKAMENQPNW